MWVDIQGEYYNLKKVERIRIIGEGIVLHFPHGHIVRIESDSNYQHNLRKHLLSKGMVTIHGG